MTVARLADGGLLLHSPIPHTPALAQEIAALGPVTHLVAPNRVHHLYLGPWTEACPDATLHGAPGLRDKRRDLVFHRELGDAPASDWADRLDQALVAGIPHVNEVVLLHRASRTLLLTDLAMNFPSLPEGFWTRLFVRAMALQGGVRTSRLIHSLVRDRAALRASLERILAWDFDRVVVSHGELCERGGRDALRSAWARLLRA
ncbi:MAG: DUF4336 domain-containing protein [Myxococcales bacterium]|nr:DUF4336 domain-containing protein [Myxococcales bacterium]